MKPKVDSATYRAALIAKHAAKTKGAVFLQSHALTCTAPDHVAGQLCFYAAEFDRLTTENAMLVKALAAAISS